LFNHLPYEYTWNRYRAELRSAIRYMGFTEIMQLHKQYANFNSEELLKPDEDDYSMNILLSESFRLGLSENEENRLNWLNRNKRNTGAFFKSIYYLGPIREHPKSIFQAQADSDPIYVGAKGENTVFVLNVFKNKKIEYINLKNNKPSVVKLQTAVNNIMKSFELCESIGISSGSSELEFIDSFGGKRRSVSIKNLGTGVSQILPIIVMGLLAPVGSLLIFEQPELHLHPKLHSRLVEFIISLSKLGKQVIIETHSEYIVKKFRLAIMNEEIKNDEINLVFFDKVDRDGNNIDGVKIRYGCLDEYGDIDYPENFKDETEEQIDKLFNASMMKLEKAGE